MERKINFCRWLSGLLVPAGTGGPDRRKAKNSHHETRRRAGNEKRVAEEFHILSAHGISEIKLAVPALLLVVQNDVADNIGDSKRSFNPDFLRVSVPPWWVCS